MEFILDNWYFVLILLVSYFFSKASGIKKEQDTEDIRFKRKGQQPAAKSPPFIQSDAVHSSEPLHGQSITSSPFDSGSDSYQISFGSSHSSNFATDHGRFPMTQNEAAQGMMWAEIFGKPRSLNPHPIRNKYRR